MKIYLNFKKTGSEEAGMRPKDLFSQKMNGLAEIISKLFLFFHGFCLRFSKADI